MQFVKPGRQHVVGVREIVGAGGEAHVARALRQLGDDPADDVAGEEAAGADVDAGAEAEVRLGRAALDVELVIPRQGSALMA